VRAVATGCCLAVSDPTPAEELVRVRVLEELRLRAVASGVLVSALDPATTFDLLRQVGNVPSAEAQDGTASSPAPPAARGRDLRNGGQLLQPTSRSTSRGSDSSITGTLSRHLSARNDISGDDLCRARDRRIANIIRTLQGRGSTMMTAGKPRLDRASQRGPTGSRSLISKILFHLPEMSLG
jgi:hypothetical protein